MGDNMAISLVLVILLLLLESTVGTVAFQQCCPEDDKHAFIQKDNICNSSKTLGLSCNNDSEVVSFREYDNQYWFSEMNDSVIIGSYYVGMIVSHESFCMANITTWYRSYYNEKRQRYEDGIVLCKETEPSGTYLGAEPLSCAVCILISGIGCFLTFLTYIVVPALRRDLLNKCLISALLCFTFAYLLCGISIIEMHRLSRHYCAYQLLFVLFWATAGVFWTNVVSFHVWRTVVFKRFPINEALLLKVYHFWGWGIPLILSLIATSLEAFVVGSGITYAVCHIQSSYAFVVILIPHPFLLFFNLLYFIWTICKLWKQEVPSSSDLKFSRFQRLRHKWFLYLKLFLLMGIPWIVYMLIPKIIFPKIVWDILTLLQGLFLFVVLVVFQKKALLGLAEQFTKWGCPCPFVATNLAVSLNEEHDEADDVEAQKDAAVFNAKEIEPES